MRRHLLVSAVLLVFLSAANGFTQVINATLSGTVSDASGAFIPGTEITAIHTGTGLVSLGDNVHIAGNLLLKGGSGSAYILADRGTPSSPSGNAANIKVTDSAGTVIGYILVYTNP